MTRYDVSTYLKILSAGLLASLAMYLVIYTGIHLTGIAPFNIPPSAAFLYNLGIQDSGYGLILHFAYGILWSFVFVFTFEQDVSNQKAILLSLILWLFMMLVYSPLIGWGTFGFGYAHHLEANHPLYLDNGFSYMFTTLLAHLVYGAILAYLTCRWFRSF